MKTSGSGCFGLGKMPRVRVGFSGSGKPDPSLLNKFSGSSMTKKEVVKMTSTNV